MNDDQVEEVFESIDIWIERLQSLFNKHQSLSEEHFRGARTNLRGGIEIEVFTEEIQESFINATFSITTTKTPQPMKIDILFPIDFDTESTKLFIENPPGYDKLENQLRHLMKKWA